MIKLTQVTPDQLSFKANGRTYLVESSLSIERYRIYEELSHLVAFGSNIEKTAEKFKKINDALSGPDVIGAIKEVHELSTNAFYGMGRNLAKRENEILLFCTLFINREEEDRRRWDEALAKEKINDWEEAGISIDSFFLFATKQISGYQTLLNRLLLEDEQIDELVQRVLKELEKGSGPQEKTSPSVG